MPYCGIIGIATGLAVAACGFVVMRDPMKLSILAPGEVGYYQRMVLDRWSRIPMRLFGLLTSLFGLVIFSAATAALLKVSILKGLSDGLMVEVGLLFAISWVFGAIMFVVQAIRGHALDWFKLRRRGIELGPVTVCLPPSSMVLESRLFTLGFSVLVAVAFFAAVYPRKRRQHLSSLSPLPGLNSRCVP